MATAYRAQRAIVITAGGVWLGNGQARGPLPEAMRHDLGELLGRAAQAFAGGEGVLMLSGATVEQLAPAAAKVAETWIHKTFREWTSFRRADGAAVHLALYDAINRKRVPLLWLDAELTEPAPPAIVAANLDQFHRAIGTPWFGTGGSTGTLALRRQYNDPRRGRQPLWTYTLPTGVRGIAPIIWDGWDELETHRKYVHVFDVNAAYCSALRNAPMAWGKLTEARTAFAPDIAGFWQLNPAELPGELLGDNGAPPLISRRLVRDGRVWVSTPVMTYLSDRGIRPVVLASLTCTNSHHVGRRLGERLASARMGMVTVNPAVLRSVKRVYAELVGMMGNAKSRVHRADWQISTMDTSAVNSRRRIDRARQITMLWPFRIQTDALWYNTDDPSPRAIGDALGMGAGMGLFRHVKTYTLAEYVTLRNEQASK